MADCEEPQRSGEAAGAIGRAIVCHDPFRADAMAPEPTQGAQEESGGGVLALVARHLDISGASGVIDGHMDKIPARPPVAAPDPCAGDAVAGLVEAPELLDIEMDQFARALTLVAADGLGRVDLHQPPQPFPPKPARDGGPREARPGGNHRPCHAEGPAQMHDQQNCAWLQPPRQAGGRACVV